MKISLLKFLIAAIIVMYISGCSPDVAAIEGDWHLTCLQGSTVTVNNNDSAIYTYSSGTGIFQQISIGSTGRDSALYNSIFVLHIKSNGSYIDSESMVRAGSSPYVNTFNDTWTYSPNDPGGGTLTLDGLLQTSFGQAYLLSLFEYNPQFKVTRLDAHNLQLTNSWSYTRTNPNPSSITNNYVLNYSR